MPGSFPRRRHSEGTPPLSPDVTRGHPPAVPLPQPHPSVAEQGGGRGVVGGDEGTVPFALAFRNR